MPSSKGTNRIQSNAGASRLLCIESCQPVAIYDLLKEDDVYLTAPGYTPCEYRGSGCFVGKDDELVASGCKKNGSIYIWHVPEDRGKELRVIEEALFTLKGGADAVCYNNTACALASGYGSCRNSNVKFWTPLPLPPSYPLPKPKKSSYIYVGEEYSDDSGSSLSSSNFEEQSGSSNDEEMSSSSSENDGDQDRNGDQNSFVSNASGSWRIFS